jgi:hypothetical protein
MNVIITSQVTYEIYGVQDIHEALDIYKECVIKRVDDTQFIGIKELFATTMGDDGHFTENPEIHEFEDVI